MRAVHPRTHGRRVKLPDYSPDWRVVFINYSTNTKITRIWRVKQLNFNPWVQALFKKSFLILNTLHYKYILYLHHAFFLVDIPDCFIALMHTVCGLSRFGKLEELLEKSFPLVKMPSIQPVVMQVLKHLPKASRCETLRFSSDVIFGDIVLLELTRICHVNLHSYLLTDHTVYSKKLCH